MRVAVAMSGGVDSSVVAKILKDEGHDLVGLFLKLWSDPTSGASCRKENRCCDYEALEDARMVAAKLNIPFYVIDAKKEFKKEVVDYFLKEYQNLRTPNPCIVCNETIKFDLLLKKALSIGCEKLATGHYAKISCRPEQREGSNSQADSSVSPQNDKFHLYKGLDETKDQSYMLYRLNQNQLSKVIFPIGEMEKKDVRELAVKWDLPVKEKPESQEICFFADRDYRAFLKRYLDEKFFASGDIVDKNGRIIGRHDGLLNYTIGQRRLIDQLVSEGEKEPLYVIGFDKEKNQLIVGIDIDIYKKEMVVGDFRWVDSVPTNYPLPTTNLSVKIRYRHPDVEVKTIEQYDNETIRVVFEKKQRAITPGQSAVFYVGDEVVGGGIIES